MFYKLIKHFLNMQITMINICFPVFFGSITIINSFGSDPFQFIPVNMNKLHFVFRIIQYGVINHFGVVVFTVTKIKTFSR